MPRESSKGRFHVVLLAGGSGSRFWPLSRRQLPKQFLALADRTPLLVKAWRRARRLAPVGRIWVAAPEHLAAQVRKTLPDLARDNLILEPSPRDTAPAVTLACATLARQDPHAVVGLFPTDQVLRNEREFVRSVRLAADQARTGALTCLGIRPDRPATSFGYLRCPRRPTRGRACDVDRFVEKPDRRRAARFFRSGNYLWNAGMFVWSVTRFLEEVDRTAPAIRRAVERHLDGHPTAWSRATRLSVDYAVMEQARGVRVVPLDAGWDDVGSWDAASRLREAEGLTDPHQILVDSPGSSVFGSGRTVAVVDVPNVVVVDTPDAVLVVSRDGSEKVRQVVEQLKKRRRQDLL